MVVALRTGLAQSAALRSLVILAPRNAGLSPCAGHIARPSAYHLWFSGSRTTAEILRCAQDDTFWALSRLLSMDAPPARQQLTPHPARSG